MMQWCYFQIFRATWRLWIQRLPRSCQTGSDILDSSWWKSCGNGFNFLSETLQHMSQLLLTGSLRALTKQKSQGRWREKDSSEYWSSLRKSSGGTLHLLAGYQVDVVGANLFIEQECGLGPIRGIGAHISCAFLHKKRNRIFSDKVYMYSSCFK